MKCQYFYYPVFQKYFFYSIIFDTKDIYISEQRAFLFVQIAGLGHHLTRHHSKMNRILYLSIPCEFTLVYWSTTDVLQIILIKLSVSDIHHVVLVVLLSSSYYFFMILHLATFSSPSAPSIDTSGMQYLDFLWIFKRSCYILLQEVIEYLWEEWLI